LNDILIIARQDPRGSPSGYGWVGEDGLNFRA